MENESFLPQTVIEAYPSLVGDEIKYIGRFIPKVPATPDRIYDVYNDTINDRLLTHVTTDYPDPVHDSYELQEISKGKYVFKDIITPNSADGMISIVDNDDFKEEFFIKDDKIYHYVAITVNYSVK